MEFWLHNEQTLNVYTYRLSYFPASIQTNELVVNWHRRVVARKAVLLAEFRANVIHSDAAFPWSGIHRMRFFFFAVLTGYISFIGSMFSGWFYHYIHLPAKWFKDIETKILPYYPNRFFAKHQTQFHSQRNGKKLEKMRFLAYLSAFAID